MTEKRFYCDDGLSKRDYAIFDLSKSDKSFNDFEDGEGFVESWRFDCYLCDETDSLMTGEEVVNKLNELYKENKLHKERISLLSSLLDLADAIIDTRDNEKAKKVWENKNEQTEKEWERILND